MNRAPRLAPLTWAEDRALRRCTRNADSGAGAERRAGVRCGAVFLPFSFNIQASHLRGTTPQLFDRMSPP
jgi:hypothetical protein